MRKTKEIIGYTAGVYDLFHIGHLNLLKNAKGMCDKLVVGITVDDLVQYKGKKALIPYEDRAEIVRSIKYVDAVIPQYDMDKVTACKKLGASILFVGDDWYGTEKWKKYEKELKEIGVDVIYFPYTKGVSSTRISEALKNTRGWSIDNSRDVDTSEPKAQISKNKIDKNFCLSSYFAYRYIWKDNKEFYKGMKHKLYKPIDVKKRIPVKTAADIDREIKKQIDKLYKKYKKIGILLSGGMDSAILAAYLKPGSNAYTFTTNLSDSFNEDIDRAKKYCEKLNLNHILVNVDFETYKKYTPIVMKTKCAPVHSIEPQIYKAALLAESNGDELILVGESSDLIFGGMDKLISKEWTKKEFINRYTFLDPKLVLNDCDLSVYNLYDKYDLPNDKIDYLKFMDEVFAIESSSSYLNAFNTAKMKYYDPYAILIMKDKLDLERVRNGESKYLIRELFGMKYPEIPIPEKIPMPRPVDKIFENWEGPTRPEFRKDIPMEDLTGNQKWQLWCAEQFLNIHEE